MTDERDDQLDRISARFEREHAQARKHTLWLSLAPVLVGLAVVGSAWLGVSEAKDEQRKAEAKTLEAERVRQALLRETQDLEAMRAELEKEIAEREALIEHVQEKLSEEARREVQYVAEGLNAVQEEDYKRAITTYQKALDLDADNPAALNSAGYAYYKDGQYKEAVELLEKATRLDPDFAEAFFNLGFALWQLDERDATVDAFDMAFELDPSTAARAQNRKDYEPIWSYRELKNARSLQGGDEQAAVWSRARQLARERDYPEAIDAFHRFLELRPDNAMANTELGEIYYLAGRHEAAAKTLERTLFLEPEFAEAHYLLGLTMWELGDHERAMEELDTAFRLDRRAASQWRREPRYQRIQKALARN
ncbi:MAG: tetratricopeptide repeat protein [Thermoanaerobaculia bacterium]